MTTKRPLSDYFRFHLGHARWRLAVFVVVATVNGVVDTIGIAMFLPVVELTISDKSAVSELSQQFLSILSAIGVPANLIGVLGLMCLMFIAKGFMVFASRVLLSFMRLDLEEKLRSQLADAIRDADYGYVMSRKISEFSALFDTEIQGVLRNFQSLADLISASATVAIYILASFFVDPVVGGISIAFGVVFGLAIRFMTRRIQHYSRAVTRANMEVESHFLDYLNAYKYLKATETTAPILGQIRGTLKHRRNQFVRMNAFRSSVNAAIEPLGIIVVSIFVFVLVELHDKPVAPVILSLAYLYRSVSRVGLVHQSWQGFSSGIGSIEVVQDAFQELRSTREEYAGKPVQKLASSIDVSDVTVVLGGRTILDRVSVSIAAGEMVGLVGETGAGKSTLADIVVGLRRPDSGTVYRDGVAYKDLSTGELRSRNGYVTQEPVLFHGSVAANVSLWQESPETHAASSPKLIDALAQAEALEFVENMSDGAATVVGTRGHRLSGGQVQRLAIAREFYRDSDLLVFDEATSALDAQTDRAVISALKRFAKSHAVIIISHRITNLRHCDRIIVMSNGRISESGTWDELCRNENSWFSRSVSLQRDVDAEDQPSSTRSSDHG